ncbi:hypothetical protein FH972_002644 [Carpinus fangiana]|uniref:Uncharacterized protein n=1 Tax=Carpinus fangiana TaxID=176857 RepID=A0A5N6QFI0_9ROSI|nr:hypothetical protein FH972_002644 [Carpinus fangiana]
MEDRLAQQMDAMSAALIEQFAAQMVAYEARFCLLEGSTVVSSEPEVTTERAVRDLGSPACHIVGSSADSTQDDDQNEARCLTPVGQKSRLSKTTMG